MLTIFTVPKPFEGHIGVIQRQAIRSWTLLRPRCQVILCGDEAGTDRVAAEFRVEQITEISRNQFGTPLLNFVFRAAEERATHDLLCYVNADIILFSDLIYAARRVSEARRRFLMVGQAWDLDVEAQLQSGQNRSEVELRHLVEQTGAVRPVWAIDYFVYPRGAIGRLPAFAVGRPWWDNWMIYHARSLRIAVVDATAATLAIHQNHDYGHVAQRTGERWEGPEADANRLLMGGAQHYFSLRDATHRLKQTGRLVPAWTPADIRRRVRVEEILTPSLRPAYRRLWALRRAWRRSRG